MMLRLRLLLILAGLIICAHLRVAAQAGVRHELPKHDTKPSDLANVLVQMARVSHVPLIAELVWPLPQVPCDMGTPLNEQTLNQLVHQTKDYEWEKQGKVFHFYNKKLRHAKFNFLDQTFPKFTIPSDLSEFKMWFPAMTIGLLEGYTGEGAAISAFPDQKFQEQKLHSITLNNVSALEVLLHVADEAPIFYSLVTFSSVVPTKSDAEKRVSWQWGNLTEEPKTIYVQPPSSK